MDVRRDEESVIGEMRLAFCREIQIIQICSFDTSFYLDGEKARKIERGYGHDRAEFAESSPVANLRQLVRPSM